MTTCKTFHEEISFVLRTSSKLIEYLAKPPIHPNLPTTDTDRNIYPFRNIVLYVALTTTERLASENPALKLKDQVAAFVDKLLRNLDTKQERMRKLSGRYMSLGDRHRPVNGLPLLLPLLRLQGKY